MAVGIPQQPGAAPGTAADPAGVAPGSESTLTPNIGPSSTNTVAYLRAAELPQRDAALSRVEAQLLETNRAVSRLPQVPANLPVTSQVEFAAAMQELQAREAQLRISLLQAQQAEEDQWVEARNRLAFDYDAFTNALLRARAAGNTNPTATAVAE